MNQASINQKDVGSTMVPVIDREGQQRIASEVERQLAVADRTASEIDVQLARAARLRESILQRAFSGRLVPQDPAHEPAESLLKRLLAQRASRSPSPSRRSRAGA